MKPVFTIITPSLQRDTLYRACASVDSQSLALWEHLVMLDVAEVNEAMFHAIYHPQRRVMQCDYPHRNYGNACRNRAWEMATGDWLLYLDDDNYLANPNVLQRISEALEGRIEQWALFPITRHGQRFYRDPPGTCYVDTANMVIRREVGQWPDGPEYTMDGIFCERLKDKYPYAAFPDMEPIVVMEHSLEGK